MADQPPVEPLLVVTGPTASGKTAMAVEIAARSNREILSMDSMTVYRRMDIGTAKPTAAERARVPHHLIDLVEPHEAFDTARWCAAAEQALADLAARGKRALFVGGTPLYLMAFFKGMLASPPSDPALRAALAARDAETPGSLHEELLRLDPAAAARIHPKDLRRLVRAHEVLRQTGRTISSQQRHFDRADWARPCRVAVVERSRADLHERVRERAEQMLAAGLLAETEAIERGGGFSRTSGAAIGYAECRDFLRGRYKNPTELRNRIRRNTHQLIRRQATWLRRLPDVARVPAAGGADALAAALGLA
ncbi:MAG: tRNA (adenosine(37)-N6)-dimethylallyltransferase MiaA [Planctomycetes bacterium]|nr:tRNA (adenosine(37)-N6)-dimethylallyltransferase MiaA [Planctomycetota bacterium]